MTWAHSPLTAELRSRLAMNLFRTLVLVAGTVGSAAQNPVALPGSTAVGRSAAAVDVTVTIKTAGSAAAVQAVTQGLAGADFAASGGTCVGTTYAVGQQCTVSVVFQPKYPGMRTGAVRVSAADGTVLGVTLLTGVGMGGLPVLSPGRIDTVIGSGQWIYRGDGVPGNMAQIFLPMGVFVDAGGNMFVSDANNNRVRRVDAHTGLISTVAGNGVPGFAGDGGPATQAMVSLPSALTLDGAGNIFFVDNGNHAVRRVDAVTHVITTVAGVGSVQGYAGDGGLATAAKLSLPEGLAFDAAGDLFIADTGNNVVRRVDAVTGIITTFAGTGQGGYNGDNRSAVSAWLNSPWNLAFGADGSLYIADLTNNRVRRVSAAGQITTVAGTGTRSFSGDGTSAATAGLNAPAAVAVDPAGNIYIADSANNRVRKILASNGTISTITGTGSEEFDGDAGPANMADLYGPYALFFDQSGNLLVADMFHNRVRSISATTLALKFDPIRVSKVSPPVTEGLQNDGNADVTVSGFALANAALDAATTTCAVGTLGSDQSCNLGVEFAPVTVGMSVAGSVAVNSDAANSPNVVSLSGQALTVEPTTVAVTSSENPSLLSDAVVFTATVTSADTSRGGTVTFLDGTVTICAAVTLTSSGTATCTSSVLALGQHSITASYAGDANNEASVSPALTQVVKQNAGVSLAVSPNPAVVGTTVVFTATATATTGTPTGSVTFYDGSTAIGSMNLNAGGVATMSTSSLSAATHSLTAKYTGDLTNAPNTSNAVSEVISLATTMTTLATSNATVPVGTSITLTANVVSTNGPAATGAVKFVDGAATLGTGTLNGSGVATLMLSTLSPGSHNLVATYVGDSNDATSDSSALVETVQQLGTTTLLSSTVNPASAGGAVQFTATVAIVAGSIADGAISGQVTFSDGAVTLGTGAVNASGVATFSTSALSVGAHTISATYAGNTNYATSASAALSETVNQTATVTSLTAPGAGMLAGKAVVLTATVTSATGVPTGTVTFFDGAASLGQGSVNASGVAMLTTSNLAVGNHTLTAVYAGDANYVTSTSSPLPQAIALGTSTLALSGPTAAVDAGTMATFAVTLGTNGVAPTGTVTLREGSVGIATMNVTKTGTYQFTSSTMSVGTHTLMAAYTGDANNSAAASNNAIVDVEQGATTTTLQSNKNPQILNQSVTLTVSVTSNSPNIGGSVSFMDGATVIGSSPVANGGAVLSTSTLTAGTHTLTAVYSGDTNHGVSTSPAISELIVQSSSVVLEASANPAVAGANLVFTAKVSGAASAAATGVVTFLDGTALLGTGALDASGTASYATTGLAVGSHSVTASYAGDGNYSKVVSAVLVETVTNANTQVALTASANPATYGSPLTLKAAITTNGGVATGSVNFTDGGAAVGSAVIDATGVATFTTSGLAPGAHSLVANYAGDGKASASLSVPLAISVKQTTTAGLVTSVNPAQTVSPIVLTATLTNAGQNAATGAVTFTDGTTQLGTGTLDATGHASLTVPSLSAGVHTIVANYAGDGANFSAISSPLTESVQLRSTTMGLTATATGTANSQQVTLISVVRFSGTTAPSGTVTFKTGSTVIGSAQVDATGVATLNIVVQAASELIVASYAGDAVYAGSDSAATAISGGPATQFTLQASPPSMTVQSKQHGVVSITLSSVKGFTDTMEFGCLGLPFAATCTFSQTQMVLKADGTATVQLTIDTGNPLGAGAVASNAHASESNVLLCFLPAAMLAGLAMWRARRRTGRAMPLAGLLMLLLAAAATFSATGCEGLVQNGTPAGTYSFQVRAAGQGTGASQAQTMTLTVTQ